MKISTVVLILSIDLKFLVRMKFISARTEYKSDWELFLHRSRLNAAVISTNGIGSTKITKYNSVIEAIIGLAITYLVRLTVIL